MLGKLRNVFDAGFRKSLVESRSFLMQREHAVFPDGVIFKRLIYAINNIKSRFTQSGFNVWEEGQDCQLEREEERRRVSNA